MNSKELAREIAKMPKSGCCGKPQFREEDLPNYSTELLELMLKEVDRCIEPMGVFNRGFPTIDEEAHRIADMERNKYLEVKNLIKKELETRK